MRNFIQTTKLSSIASGVFLLGATTLLSGCSGITATSGAASMRIDVDVYQGPLSMEPEMQWGALFGQVEEGVRRLDGLIMSAACVDKVGRSLFRSGTCSGSGVIASSQIRSFDPYRTDDQGYQNAPGAVEKLCSNQVWLKNIKETRLQTLISDICALRTRTAFTADWMNDWDASYRTVLSEIGKLNNAQVSPFAEVFDLKIGADEEEKVEARDDKKKNLSSIQTLKGDLINVMADVAALAEEMRIQSLFYANSHVGHASQKRRVRTAIVDFAAFAAEYSNTLKSRADALLKQAGGVDRRELSLSSQLRDASPTAFVNLYVWNKAANERVVGEPTSTAYFRDRVRVINRLVSDEAWTRVNTAYASGQGDVSMAFIKDDIGNWNLKSFDNDPTALLQAYKDVGQAALGAAVTIASGGSAGSFRQAERALDNLSKTQSALLLAENIAYGGGSTSIEPAENRTLKRLHASTLSRLKELKREYEKEAGELDGKIASVTTKLNEARQAVEDADEKIADQTDNIPEEAKGKTVEGLRLESAALKSRVVQLDTDKSDANTAMTENDAAFRAKTTEIGEQQAKIRVLDAQIKPLQDRLDDLEPATVDGDPDRAIREELSRQIQALEDQKKAPNETITALEEDIRQLTVADNEYGRVVEDRETKSGDLTTKANDLAGYADDVQKINTEVAKITVEERDPAKAKFDELEAELKALQERRDKGLYVEALRRTAEIIDSHERFVSELEALVVADKAPQAQPIMPAVPTPSP